MWPSKLTAPPSGGATYEDDYSLGVNLEIGVPSGGKGTALGCVTNTGRGALAVGTDVAAGLRLKAGEGIMGGSDSTPWLASGH